MEEKNKVPTIGMLVDIEHVYGQHEGRLTPWLLTLCIGGAPVLMYIYFSLFEVIPLWLFVPIELFIVLRAVMIIIGRERYRLQIFKRQLYEQYSAAADMLNIRTIHEDGCIEYNNGTIGYLVVGMNGTVNDRLVHSEQLRKFMQLLTGDYMYDLYIHNLNSMPALRKYYNTLTRFEHNQSASNFVNIIDYNINLTSDTSMVQVTVWCIKGKRSDWKDISSHIQNALYSQPARCYKSLFMVKDVDAINEILNRNSDTIINMESLIRKKYATGSYASSKVLAYDLPDDKYILQGKQEVEPVIPPAPSHSFHVPYTEVVGDDVI